MPKRSRISKREVLVQESAFLNLPPEIRNKIYELAAQHESVSMRDGDLLYSPPLSLTCRQVREEYKGIYLEEAPKHAETMCVHVWNFRCATTNPFLNAQGLPFLPGPHRKYILRMFLDNTWTRLQFQRFFFKLALPRGSTTDFEIRYNPKSFDEEYLRQTVPRMAWYNKDGTLSQTSTTWERMVNAIYRAFDRYESVGRKRKRGLGTY